MYQNVRDLYYKCGTLLPKVQVSLDDHERRNGRYFALF